MTEIVSRQLTGDPAAIIVQHYQEIEFGPKLMEKRLVTRVTDEWMSRCTTKGGNFILILGKALNLAHELCLLFDRGPQRRPLRIRRPDHPVRP